MKIALFIFLGGTLLLGIGAYYSTQPDKQYEDSLARQGVRLLCVEGYTFVLYSTSDKAALSQMFIVGENGLLIPSTCDEASYPLAAVTSGKNNMLEMAYFVFFTVFIFSCGVLFFVKMNERNLDKHKQQKKVI